MAWFRRNGVNGSRKVTTDPDPTRNVLDLVYAATERQDDLREAESRHIREVGSLREHFNSELRVAETARIDAIRAVDVGQQATLATQVALSAETLRTQVQTTATQAQTSLNAALDPIKNDIAELRKAQYEAQGQKAQSAEVSPLAPLIASIAELQRLQVEETTRRTTAAEAAARQVTTKTQSTASFGQWIALAGIVLFAVGIVVTILLATQGHTTAPLVECVGAGGKLITCP